MTLEEELRERSWLEKQEERRFAEWQVEIIQGDRFTYVYVKARDEEEAVELAKEKVCDDMDPEEFDELEFIAGKVED